MAAARTGAAEARAAAAWMDGLMICGGVRGMGSRSRRAREGVSWGRGTMRERGRYQSGEEGGVIRGACRLPAACVSATSDASSSQEACGYGCRVHAWVAS